MEAELLPLPDAEGRRIQFPGGPYEAAWVSMQDAFSEENMSAYALAERAAERERVMELLGKCRQIAEWHGNDGDECGTLARIVMADIDALVAVTSLKGETSEGVFRED